MQVFLGDPTHLLKEIKFINNQDVSSWYNELKGENTVERHGHIFKSISNRKEVRVADFKGFVVDTYKLNYYRKQFRIITDAHLDVGGTPRWMTLHVDLCNPNNFIFSLERFASHSQKEIMSAIYRFVATRWSVIGSFVRSHLEPKESNIKLDWGGKTTATLLRFSGIIKEYFRNKKFDVPIKWDHDVMGRLQRLMPDRYLDISINKKGELIAVTNICRFMYRGTVYESGPFELKIPLFVSLSIDGSGYNLAKNISLRYHNFLESGLIRKANARLLMSYSGKITPHSQFSGFERIKNADGTYDHQYKYGMCLGGHADIIENSYQKGDLAAMLLQLSLSLNSVNKDWYAEPTEFYHVRRKKVKKYFDFEKKGQRPERFLSRGSGGANATKRLLIPTRFFYPTLRDYWYDYREIPYPEKEPVSPDWVASGIKISSTHGSRSSTKYLTEYKFYEFDEEGFDPEGYDGNGFDSEGYDREGYDKTGIDHEGYDEKGFDLNGFDREGYGRDGFNREGFNREGNNRYVADPALLTEEFFDEVDEQNDVQGDVQNEVQRDFCPDDIPF